VLACVARDFLKGETCQFGGFSSPASQPTASVLKGSMGKETSSVRWQVLHSKVRRSNPRSPGEIRARPILCLQVGHIGRSTVGNELRISLHPGQAYAFPHSGARFCLAAAQYAFNGLGRPPLLDADARAFFGNRTFHQQHHRHEDEHHRGQQPKTSKQASADARRRRTGLQQDFRRHDYCHMMAAQSRVRPACETAPQLVGSHQTSFQRNT
jgi:hypothetical protein